MGREGVGISHCGRWVAATCQHNARIFDAADGTLIHTLSGHDTHLYTLAFTHSGGSVISAGKGGVLKLWDNSTGLCINTMEGHSGDVYKVVTTPEIILSCSLDTTLRMWGLDGSEAKVLEGHSDPILGVAVGDCGGVAVSLGVQGELRIWALPDGVCVHIVSTGGVPLNVAMSSTGGYFVVALSSSVAFWDLASAERISVTPEKMLGMVVTPCGRWMFKRTRNEVCPAPIDKDFVATARKQAALLG